MKPTLASTYSRTAMANSAESNAGSTFTNSCCARKRDEQAAQNTVRLLARFGAEYLAYPCPDCGLWHTLRTERRTQMQRLQQDRLLFHEPERTQPMLELHLL